MLQLLFTQLTDPFRIALLIALVYVWQRNHAQSQALLPLLAGWIFVAVVIPVTGSAAGPMLTAVLVGLVANAVILAVVLGAWVLWRRSRKG
jgi:uncharacterized membrane protein